MESKTADSNASVLWVVHAAAFHLPFSGYASENIGMLRFHRLAYAAFFIGLPVTAVSQQAARLFPGPGVLVNGAHPLAQEVLPGDRLRIPAKSAAHLNSGADEVTLGEQSEAVYQSGTLTLTAGQASIESKSGMATKVHHFTITPTVRPVKYEVVWHDMHGWVTVIKGQVEVSGGTHNLTVPSGKTAELDETHEKPIAYLKAGGIRPLVIAGGAGAAAAAVAVVLGTTNGHESRATSVDGSEF